MTNDETQGLYHYYIRDGKNKTDAYLSMQFVSFRA